WLYRFHASVSLSRSRQLLCHSREIEPQDTAALFEPGGSQHGFDLRSNRRVHRLLCSQGLRSTVATNSVQRFGEQQDAGLSDQQLRTARTDDHRAVSVSLAGRVVLQMDKTAFANQGLF